MAAAVAAESLRSPRPFNSAPPAERSGPFRLPGELRARKRPV